jgi:hypothetical protein
MSGCRSDYGKIKGPINLLWMAAYRKNDDLFDWLLERGSEIIPKMILRANISFPQLTKLVMSGRLRNNDPGYTYLFLPLFSIELLKLWLRQGVQLDPKEIYNENLKRVVEQYNAIQPFVMQYHKRQGWTNHELFDKNLLQCIKRFI